MKKVLLLAITALFLTNCTSEDSLVEVTPTSGLELSGKSMATDAVSGKVLLSSTVVTVSTVARGFSETITIKNGLLTKSSTGVVPPTTVTLSAAKWAQCKQKFSALNLASIPTYVAPSCLRCADKDRAQTLEIKHQGVSYISTAYDSTNPPAALKSFLTFVKTLN